MDECGAAPCGIYVRGDVRQMVLKSEAGRQVLLITLADSWDAVQRTQKIVIDPVTLAVTRCWSPAGIDPGLGTCAGWAGTKTYAGWTFNGLFYIDGAIQSTGGSASGLFGIVNRDTRLTIAANGEIRVTDHLVYETPPAGPGHNPTNLLGLWSRTSNVTIVGSLAPNDLYIDAAVLAPAGQFWVEGWSSLPPKGNVHFLGSAVQATFGAFGGFNPQTGYGRVMTYDWRFHSDLAPPAFPVTGVFTVVRPQGPPWTGSSSVFANGDPLYDPPQWEEMAAP
jgi:hypothetical protein